MTFNKTIKAKKCKKCGFLQHQSHLRCLNCRSVKFEEIEASGQCKLLTYTVLKAVPAEFLEKKSYAIGIVEFENGVRALGQITSQEGLKTGMHLRSIFSSRKLDGKEIHTYFFEPIVS